MNDDFVIAHVFPSRFPFIVYCLSCHVTGLRYIGQTRQGLKKRWQTHVSASRGPAAMPRTLIAQAIREHGPEAWDRAVLERCATANDAAMAEARWVLALGTLTPSGYNAMYPSDRAAKDRRVPLCIKEVVTGRLRKRVHDDKWHRYNKLLNKAFEKAERRLNKGTNM